MRKLLIFLLAFMIVGAASGLPYFGPAQGFATRGSIDVAGDITVLGSISTGGANITNGVIQNAIAMLGGKDFSANAGDGVFDWSLATGFFNTSTGTNYLNGNVSVLAGRTVTATGGFVGPLTGAVTGDLTGTASRIAVGTFIDTDFGLSNVSSNKVKINIAADHGLEFSTGALQVEAGDGIDTSSSGVAVDVTDVIVTTHGLYEPSANNIGVNLTEDGGLGFGTGADSGALIIYPYYGLKTTSNGLEVNLTANKGLEFGTGAAEKSLQIKLDGSTLALGSSGIKLSTTTSDTISNLGSANIAQNVTAANVALGQTWQNTSLTNNGLAHTAINSSIAALVVPLATFNYVAASVDQGVFTASGGWVLTAVKMTPRVVGSDGGGVAVMVKICDSGEAPASGDNMLSGTLDLKGTADTPQSGTVSAGTIANGKIVALDFTGTLTGAVGTITLYGTRA